ncbi:chromosome condensation protein CrcB [Lactiplantibacillus garii]|uniref:Fluoride-specific ion channel FluC n=1 Tax=Lactiplantibacillus garii TaxID=2306423 RepID=A0A426D768_9LACO|nr:CrcB family protein [Lactiplantibacillus garii]RRK10438.1 chromosome condensation protein CrcB [Lactiplantibacillus garii]
MLTLTLLAGGGAAIGALGRFAIMHFARPLNDRWPLPIATLFINLTGAFLLGLLLARTLPLNWQVFLGTGITGGYTTFSTMINEVVLLARHHHWHVAWTYLGTSLIGGLALAFLGNIL